MSAPFLLPSSESGPVLDSAAGVTTNAAEGVIIAPFVAALDTSGEAFLTAEQLSQLSVTIANVQRTFKVSLDLAQTTAFLNSFTVSKNGANLTLDLSANAFEVIMDQVIAGAQDAAADAIPAVPANGVKGRAAKDAGTVAQWLTHGLKNTLVDYILRTLKVAATVTSAPVTVNADSAASKSMSAGLGGNSNTLEAIYLQIAQGTLELYRDTANPDENIPTTNALPLKGGDKMVFVFDTAPLTVTTTVNQTQSNASGAAVNASGGRNVTDPTRVAKGAMSDVSGITNLYAQPNPGQIVMTDTYRVAFEVTMGGTVGVALPLSDAPVLPATASATEAGKLRRVDKTWWNYA